MIIKILAIIFLCFNFGSNILGARILGVLHVPSNSHNIIGVTLLNSLAERGHQVTILSAIDPKLNNSNVRYLSLEGITNILTEYRYIFRGSETSNSLSYYIYLNSFTNNLVKCTLNNDALKNLMNSGEKFDIVFIEPFLNQALVGLGQHFNAQIIVLSTSDSYLANMLFGNEVPYSFVPNTMSSYTDEMNFQERLSNTILYFIYHIIHKIYNEPIQKKIYKEYFPHALDFNEAVKNVSLHFVNTHVVYESPRPYLPNMVPIGGLHVKSPKKLPKDVQQLLDNAKQGAIYFSLGSFIQSKDMTIETRKIILNTFAKMPQTILWKFEDDLPEKPDNVKISKWYPQNDILAHPNLKLFITHGGLLSTVEAIYRGVPILGIPFIFDQYSNIAQFEASGCGESIFFPHITEKRFLSKIQQILNNSSYQKNMAKASQIIHDQLETPLERAVFWTEHILKHGSSHLRPASLDLSTAQYLLLDVAAFIILIILITSLIVYYILKKTLIFFFESKEHYKKE